MAASKSSKTQEAQSTAEENLAKPSGDVQLPDAESYISTGKSPLQSIALKRSVTMKTLVTDSFKDKARAELSREVQLVDQQFQNLENQYQQTLKQLEALAAQGKAVGREMDQLAHEANQRRQQLNNMKAELTGKLQNVDQVENGTFMVTGMLENFVEVKVGDNIYDRVQNAEIIVRDGIITAIHG